MLRYRRSLADLLCFGERKLKTCIIVLIFLAYKPSVHVVGVGRVEFVKYTLYDGYVRSCSQKEENFAFEDVLEVRQYEPPLDAIQQAWDAAGKEYPVSAEEGTLYPFDRSSMSGWCGEDSAGDRVTFIMFDLRDFNETALGKVELRMTPKSFPSIAKVEVRGYCDTNWHEKSLTYITAPHLDNTTTICNWSGDEEIKYYDEPLTCDVTKEAKQKAGNYLCLSIDMERKTTNSREPVVFWARELDEHSERTIAVTNFDELMGKATPLRGAALQYGTVPGSTDKASWKPHLLIEGSGKGMYPDHSAEDLP